MFGLKLGTFNKLVPCRIIFLGLLFSLCLLIKDKWSPFATYNTNSGYLLSVVNDVNITGCKDQVVEVKHAGVYGNQTACSNLSFDEVTDESLLKFYQTCVFGADKRLPVGRELFKALFVGKVFTNKCKEKLLKFISGQELVALASFPGSGNTWTRELLEQLTGRRIQYKIL